MECGALSSVSKVREEWRLRGEIKKKPLKFESHPHHPKKQIELRTKFSGDLEGTESVARVKEASYKLVG